MPLETGTYISDLNDLSPAHTDPQSQGDGHMRLIKHVLKSTFTAFTGALASSNTQVDAVIGTGGTATLGPPGGTNPVTISNTGAVTVPGGMTFSGSANFASPPTIGGVSLPAGLGIGEIRKSLGTSDVTYSNGEAWLICDGRTLNAAQQTTYAAYVAAHGATLPNFANRTPRGYAPGGTGPGNWVGSDSVSLSVSNMPSHNHPGSTTTPESFDSGHGHPASTTIAQRWGTPGGGDTGIVDSGPVDPLQSFNASTSVQASPANIQNPTVATNVAFQGSGSSFSVVPNSTIVTYFVRVS